MLYKDLSFAEEFLTLEKKKSSLSYILAVCVLVLLVLYWAFIGGGGKEGIFVVNPGSSLIGAVTELDNLGYIKSSTVGRLYIKIQGHEGVKSGSYKISAHESVFSLINRLETGDFQLPYVRITIPEGLTNEQIAERLAQSLQNFPTATFLSKASKYEGFLFPETYSFLPNQTVDEILASMINTTYAKYPNISTSTIILASIIEEEGKTPEDMKNIADVLLKRMNIKMPLQVDASLSYYLHRTTYELTNDDLTTDHPYNTYTRLGLPPTAISNPGDAAIQAALNPTPNPYWYYVSDRRGTIYFAKTFAEHLRLVDIHI